MKEPCHGFSQKFSPISRLMIIWIATARRTDSSVGVVKRFIVGVGMEAVAVVEYGVQRLQGRSDVVELYLLRVQAASLKSVCDT